MKYLNKPVAYLENQDFDQEGNLLISQTKPVLIMLQSNWCPHCTNAKPAFQQFANINEGKIFCATIQADGDRLSEKNLGKRAQQIKNGFRGFPDYVLYINGKPINKNVKNRTVEALQDFVKEYI